MTGRAMRGALIAAVSLWLPFANYGFAGDLIGGDANAAWALPGEELRAMAGVFANYPGLGLNASEGIQGIFPALLGAAALHGIGLSSALVARLMIALYFFVALAGAERLGNVLLARETPWVRNAGALAGALLYGVNAYTIHVFGTAETYFPLGYIAMPWLVYGVLVGCERDRRIGIAAIAVATSCAGGVAVNPAFFGIALLAVPFGAALALAGGAPWRRVLLVCGGGLGLGLGLCAWWVLPSPTAFAAGLGQLGSENVSAWVEWMSTRSGFEQLFKLDGYVGAGSAPFAAWYASPLGSLLGYVPLLVAVGGAGAVRRRSSALALIAFAVFVFLGKGVHAPGGGLYHVLLDHVPGFSVFRSPYDKWAQLEALALLVAYDLGLAGLIRRAGSRPGLARACAAAAIAPLVAFPWPAYAGRILQASPDPQISFVTALPDDYRQVAAFLRGHTGEGRALVLNAGGPPYPIFSWGYFGEDPLPIAAGVPVAGPDVIPRAPVLAVASLERAMDALGVRYVVVHDDLRNPLPQADPALLVARGALRLVLTTPTLRVFERMATPAAVVSLVHDPALIDSASLPPPSAGVDPLATAQLVPNAASELAGPGATLLVGAAGAVAQPGDAVLGRITRLSGGEHANAFGAIPGNAPSAVPSVDTCPGGRPAIRLEAAAAWIVVGRPLASFARTFCLRGRPAGGVGIDGTVIEAGVGSVPLGNRVVHMLTVRAVLASVRGRATHNGRSTVFRFIARSDADTLEVFVPAELRSPNTVAQIDCGGLTLGAGNGALGATSFLLPLTGGSLHEGQVCSLDFRSSAKSERALAAGLATVGLAAEHTILQNFVFALPDAAYAAVALRPPAPGLPALQARRVPPVGVPPEIAWDLTPGRHAASGSLDLIGSKNGQGARASGVLATADAYRLRGRYIARGDATLTLTVDGDAVPRAIGLVADGRLHDIDEMVYPPALSAGTYRFEAGVASGSLRLIRLGLATEGPNALEYALRAGHAGGTLLVAHRLAPWWFAATVRDCVPCVLRVAVSWPQQWLVRGARVLGVYEGAGQSTGASWSDKVTGAATWVLDAGPGERTIGLFFWPAFLAGLGLLVTIASLGWGGLLLRRSAAGRAFAQRDDLGRLPTSAEGLRIVTLVLGAAVAVAGETVLADRIGAVLWIALVLFGFTLLGRGATGRRVGATP